RPCFAYLIRTLQSAVQESRSGNSSPERDACLVYQDKCAPCGGQSHGFIGVLTVRGKAPQPRRKRFRFYQNGATARFGCRFRRPAFPAPRFSPSTEISTGTRTKRSV